MDLDDLRDLMKLKRERVGLSQFELAERVGVSQAYIARIEAGAADDVSHRKVTAILAALNADSTDADDTERKARQKQIKDALLDAGYTLRDLAREMGVHDSTVGAVVAGKGKSQRIEARIQEITGL